MEFQQGASAASKRNRTCSRVFFPKTWRQAYSDQSISFLMFPNYPFFNRCPPIRIIQGEGLRLFLPWRTMKRTATTSDRLHDELFTQAFWPCSSSWQIIPRSRHDWTIQHLMIRGAGTPSFWVAVPHQRHLMTSPAA